MKIGPLIISQLVSIIILVIAFVSPWQNVKYSFTEEIGGKNVTTNSNYIQSIYQKPIIHFNGDQSTVTQPPITPTPTEITPTPAESTPATFLGLNHKDFDDFGKFTQVQIMFFTVFSVTVAMMILYTIVIRLIMKSKSRYSFEVFAHSFPLMLVILTIALSFIISDYQTNICVDNFYTSITPSTSNSCFKLKVDSVPLPLYNEKSQQTASIQSIPYPGYYLVLISVLCSFVISFIHTITYDELKESNSSVSEGVASILGTTILETSYYYDNIFDSNISGCNFTGIIKVKYDTEGGAIDNLYSTNNNSPLYSERLYSFNEIGIFKLIGYLKTTGQFTSALNGTSLNGTDMGELSGIISFNCHSPPTEKDLKIIVTDKPTPIIKRNNQLYLFQVAINVTLLEHKMGLSFLLKDINSPFSLDYQQITNQIFILKFKLRNPLLFKNNKPIEIIPQNYFGLENSQYPLNYTSFKVTSLISQYKEVNQFSNINFYLNNNEIYSYVLFDVKNDNDIGSIVPCFSSVNDKDKQTSISIAYPIQGNSTHSKFIGSIKPSGNSTLYLSSTSNIVSATFITKIKDTYLTYSPIKVLEIQNYCLLAPFLWSTSDYVPKDYSISTMDGLEQKYIEYWGILSFVSNSLQLSFGHSIVLSKYFNNDQITTKVKFYNDQNKPKGIRYSGIPSGSLNQSPIVSDMLLTRIQSTSSFYYGGWIIRFTVTQTLPFYYLKINKLKVTALNFVGQTDLNGDSLYEIRVDNNFIRDISMKPFTIYICDIAFNYGKTTYSAKELTQYNPLPSLILPIIEFKSIYNINSLFFKNNQINTTSAKSKGNKPIENTIYIGTKAGISASSDDGIYLILNSSNSIILNKKLQFNWDSTIGLFYCNFQIPLNYYSGIFDYSIQYYSIVYGYSSIFTIIGDNSTLIVKSIQSDMLPPLVESITPVPNNQVLRLNKSSELNIFGWDIVITEGINGFKYGEFNITSEFDKHGFSFTKTSKDLIQGNKLSIRINLNDFGPIKDCINQHYTISSVYLIDKQGYHTSRSNNDEISALFMVSPQDNSITLDCTSSNTLSVDVTLPHISEYIMDSDFKHIDYSVQEKHFIKFNFSIADNESGVSSRHDPTIYFEDSSGNLLSISNGNGLRLLESNETTNSYLCVALFPFGFGYPSGVSISIYGLVDNYMNVAGYDPVSLNRRVHELYSNSTFIPFINVLYSSSAPYISDIIPRYDTTFKKAQFIVRGYLFGTDLTKVEVIVDNINSREELIDIPTSLVYKSILNASNPLPFSVSSFSGNEVVIDVEISHASTPDVQIQFVVDNKTSNTYNFILQHENSVSTSSDSDIVLLLSSSSSSLSSSSTTTTPAISPILQSSKSLKAVYINVDPSSPSASLNHKDTHKLSSFINIHEIREINSFTNQTIHTYNLIENWVPIISNITNQYHYSNTLPNKQSSIIYAIINVFDNESTFSFTNKIYKVNEKSIKFTLNITNYQTESPLNNVQLVMQAQLISTQTKDVCSKKVCSLDTDQSDILSIQINDKSLYCRFLKTALVDGGLIIDNLTNINLNSEYSAFLKPNSGQFYYGIMLPSFKHFVIIDPDFSLLIESTTLDSNSDGSICSKSKHHPILTIGEIAGIVIGGAALIFIIVIIVTYLIFSKHRFSSFTMSIRQWSFKRRSKSRNSI